jgi:23S rRNA pseudouridine955/2504/2580 synthase/23S rRNA pseudouridine1911/1915/1917 synthase
MQLDIIFENDFFVAINKPSGLLSVPDRKQLEPNLKDMLLAKYGHIYTVHRLDKDTSGLIVFAKDEHTHKQLSMLFEGREVDKQYMGLVMGNLYQPSGSIDAAIMMHPANDGTMMIHSKGKPALTDYDTLETFKHYTWLQFKIYTGRTHQIRLHMKHIGHSIVCDVLYGDGKPLLLSSIKKKFKLSKLAEEERPLLNRLALHSHQLGFTLHEQRFNLEAPLPKDLRAMLQQLRKNDA